jgi:hypothetical protein
MWDSDSPERTTGSKMKLVSYPRASTRKVVLAETEARRIAKGNLLRPTADTSRGNTMKPPKGWSIHDDNWFIKIERVTDDRWFLLFLKRPEALGLLPVGWINITVEEWVPGGLNHSKATNEKFYVRDFELKEGSLLELECIVMEWRKDILEGRTNEAANDAAS